MLSLEYGPGYAELFQDQIKEAISEVNEACEAEILLLMQRTRDAKPVYLFKELSERLTPIVPRLRELGTMDGGLSLAFDLILYLGRQSYTEMGTVGNTLHRRPSDSPSDELLLDLAGKKRAEDEAFRPVKAVEMLKSDIEYLAQYNIHTYFPKSFKLLASWFQPPQRLLPRRLTTKSRPISIKPMRQWRRDMPSSITTRSALLPIGYAVT
jgi:hypothetical protein